MFAPLVALLLAISVVAIVLLQDVLRRHLGDRRQGPVFRRRTYRDRTGVGGLDRPDRALRVERRVLLRVADHGVGDAALA